VIDRILLRLIDAIRAYLAGWMTSRGYAASVQDGYEVVDRLTQTRLRDIVRYLRRRS
jgi:hypothetical protein